MWFGCSRGGRQQEVRRTKTDPPYLVGEDGSVQMFVRDAYGIRRVGRAASERRSGRGPDAVNEGVQ